MIRDLVAQDLQPVSGGFPRAMTSIYAASHAALSKPRRTVQYGQNLMSAAGFIPTTATLQPKGEPWHRKGRADAAARRRSSRSSIFNDIGNVVRRAICIGSSGSRRRDGDQERPQATRLTLRRVGIGFGRVDLPAASGGDAAGRQQVLFRRRTAGKTAPAKNNPSEPGSGTGVPLRAKIPVDSWGKPEE